MYNSVKNGETILFSLSGLGMGNSSRVIGIIEALDSLAKRSGRDISFHVVCWGSGYRFLKSYLKNSELPAHLTEAHAYGHGATAFLTGIRTYLKNVLLLRRLVKNVSPRLIVLDSDYHFPAFFGSRSQRVFIGQAYDVISRAHSGSYKPKKLLERLNFIFREKVDKWIQGFFSDTVLVPCFSRQNVVNGRFHCIPLIVRESFLTTPHPTASGKKPIGIILSGSEADKDSFLSVADQHGIHALTPSNKSDGELEISTPATIDDFDVVFTQGGLSSISECIARHKFIVVFPLNNHPEQYLNACEVENLGLGMRAHIGELADFPALLAKIDTARKRARSKDVVVSGARDAAKLIFEAIHGKEEFTPELNALQH